mgnify:CR=1 FL=1
MKNLNKIMKNIFKGVIEPKIFLILFVFLFSSLAFAASLTATFLDGRIPAQNSSTCTSSEGFDANTPNFDTLDKDSTERPQDVVFSTDGLIVFTTNLQQESHKGQGNLSMNRLSRPFDMTSVRRDNGDLSCDVIDAFRVNQSIGFLLLRNQLVGINIVDNGRKFFISADNGNIARFDLSIPNEFSSRTFVNVLSTSGAEENFALSTDGTKLFTINDTNDAPVVTTYSLPGPFDISSKTQIHQVDLMTIGVEDETGNDKGDDIEFNETGSAMFVLISNDTESSSGGPRPNSYIYQYSLGKNFDVSTASLMGRHQLNGFGNVAAEREGTGQPRGFSFSADGMRIYIVQEQDGAGVDQINSFQLECPYGLVACVSDSTSSTGAQVELAKQNITLNVSTIFKRFEWIKRNRDNEELSSHNININYPNPILKSLASKFEPSLKNNLATLVSNTEKKEKISKWSSWSLVDLSISNLDKLGFEKAKTVKSLGLTYGTDRKFGNNRFLGWAIRYADGESNIHQSKQNTELESLTLNLYGIVPTNENRYINTVVGLSALRFNNKYLSKLSGERNGKQAFTSINYRTKNTLGSLNVTPTGKFTYGVTRLSEYTDFISNTINSPTIDIRYAEDTFRSGELTAGFLFDMDKMIYEDGSLQLMGGIEVLYDLTPSIDYEYIYQGETPVNKDTIIGAYSKESLKTNIGYEWIYLNGFTISPYYERVISLSNNDGIADARRKLYNEKFIIKLSKSKEENSQFAFDFDPLSNNLANLSYAKDIGNFKLKLNSNYSSINNISNYGANIELFGTF